MAKPILQYKVNTVVNPLTQEKVYTPMLTDRAPAVSLETVVKSAKDKGYLPGLKDVSAKALAEGVLSSLKDTLAAGTNVKFGDYFYAKLALNGKCDGAGRLSKQNGINVRFRQGELIKVDIDENQELAEQFEVFSIPNVCIFKNGEVADRNVGFASPEAMREFVERNK